MTPFAKAFTHLFFRPILNQKTFFYLKPESPQHFVLEHSTEGMTYAEQARFEKEVDNLAYYLENPQIENPNTYDFTRASESLSFIYSNVDSEYSQRDFEKQITPDMLIRIYHTCYKPENFIKFLQNDCTDFEKYKIFFSQGIDYSKFKNPAVEFSRFVRSLQWVQDNNKSADTSASVVEHMLTSHFRHSAGLERMDRFHLMDVLTKVLPKGEPRVIFLETLFEQFFNYQTNTIGQERAVTVMNVPLSHIRGYFDFSAGYMLTEIIEALPICLRPFYETLGIDHIFIDSFMDTHTPYYRIRIESSTHTQVPEDMLHAITWDIMSLYEKADVSDWEDFKEFSQKIKCEPDMIKEIIQFHYLQENLKEQKNTTKKIKI